MKRIEIGEIVLDVGAVDAETTNRQEVVNYSYRTCYKGGKLLSTTAREVCPYCNKPDCCYQCDQSTEGGQTEDEVAERLAYNGGLAALEGFILALAVAGVDVKSTEVQEALETVMDALGNNEALTEIPA